MDLFQWCELVACAGALRAITLGGRASAIATTAGGTTSFTTSITREILVKEKFLAQEVPKACCKISNALGY